MESYIKDKKNLYAIIHEFLEGSNDEERNETFEKIIKIIRSNPIEGNGEEMCQFLEIIKSIGEHHHRDHDFNEGINQILLHYKDQIKQTLSNLEIFHIFENNKKIVLFLLQKDIITISEEIYNEIVNKLGNNGSRYWHFFIPELENFLGEEKIEFVKNELLKEDPNFFTNYEEKRKEGENDSYICSLIRQDSVEEFIKHVNRQKISLSSIIPTSIFETNPFLIDNKNITLIEYSAFFGSIQIFQYLIMSKVELTPSLWLYAIHSKNAELIHLLESNEVPPPKNYEQCLIESIKCHHNDIADYIENNFIDQNKKDSEQEEEIISNCIKHHNYSHFENNSIIDHGFFYLNFYHYDKLFKLLLKKKEKSIEKKKTQYPDIQTASKNNEIEVIYYFLLQIQTISEELFKYTGINQIVIPSSVTSIGKDAFLKCSTLTQIKVPSSVISIEENAFYGCSSLAKITFETPSSLTSIGNSAFRECSSLIQITIPSSVTSIGNSVFTGCSSLTQITIPSSVTSIGRSALSKCSSLLQIAIPSSVTSIGDYAFSGCSLLTQITIPSSVTSIGSYVFSGCSFLNLFIIPYNRIQIEYYDNKLLLSKSNLNNEIYDMILWANPTATEVIIPTFITKIAIGSFYGCSSLTKITFETPSSVTSIGSYALRECSSLIQITIPSSVTSIESFTFSGCSSLKQITIPSSVTSIGNSAFRECSSLTQITIPSSVTSIGNSSFYGCSSLTQITIPSSVTSIGYYAFSKCSSLSQIIIPSSITIIGEGTFSECSSLTQIIIPSFVNSIGHYAFKDCTSLTQITIPSSVTSIGSYAFSGCSSLAQISIPSSVTSIGSSAFSKCSSLTQITIPSSVTSIGRSAFRECSSLTQISVPSSIDTRHLELDPITIIDTI